MRHREVSALTISCTRTGVPLLLLLGPATVVLGDGLAEGGAGWRRGCCLLARAEREVQPEAPLAGGDEGVGVHNGAAERVVWEALEKVTCTWLRAADEAGSVTLPHARRRGRRSFWRSNE